MGGSRRAPKDAGHQVRVVRCQFLHTPRSVIGDLQKQGAPRPWNRCKQANDLVIDEVSNLFGLDGTLDVWIEDLEKMTEALLFGFNSKIPIGFERPQVGFRMIVEGHRIQPQVTSALALIIAASDTPRLELFQRGGSKRH